MLDEIEHRRLCPLQVVHDEHERGLGRTLLEQLARRELRFRRRGANRLGRLDPELHQHLDEGPVRDPFAVGKRAATGDRGRSVEMLEEVRDEPGLADSRRPDEGEQPTGARSDDVGEVRTEPFTLASAADHGTLELPRDPRGRQVEPAEPVGNDRLGLSLDRELDALGGDGVANQPQRGVPQEDFPRAGRLLEPRRDVDRVTRDERVALPRHDRARVDADPRLETQAVHHLAQLDRRSRCAQRIVLRRDRDPEHRHDRVADELLDGAAVPLQDHARGLVVPVHQHPQRLGIRPLPDRGRPGQIAEQDGHDLPHLAPR